jgi:tetratricopeptide (TPR) repeat protein
MADQPRSNEKLEKWLTTILTLTLPWWIGAGWNHFFHNSLPAWAIEMVKGPVMEALGILSAALVSALLAIHARRRFLGKTPHPKGNRIAIYVAQFGEDEASTGAREAVMRSIEKELGRERAEVLPAGVRLELDRNVSRDQATERANAKARAILKKNGGDLLIWGHMATMPGMAARVELNFVSAEREHSRPEPYGLTQSLMLDADFGPEMGTALAALAATAAASSANDDSHYCVQMLDPIARKLTPIALNPPASLKPEDRARILFSFGAIQRTIGQQAGSNKVLEQAIAAFRSTLDVWTRESAPQDWARTQNWLGISLSILGGRDNKSERLAQAIVAYHEALKIYTQTNEPIMWAGIQNNLGIALRKLSEREENTGKLEQAVEAYREALKEWTQGLVPLLWATAQNNLGNALGSLGDRKNDTEKLEQAIVAFRETLKERTRKRVPLQWATTQNNLGNALGLLGKCKGDTNTLKQAVVAFHEALKERTRKRVPLGWAATQNNLGKALQALGECENCTEDLEQAIQAYREALKEWTPEQDPYHHQMAHDNLRQVEALLAERRGGGR